MTGAKEQIEVLLHDLAEPYTPPGSSVEAVTCTKKRGILQSSCANRK